MSSKHILTPKRTGVAGLPAPRPMLGMGRDAWGGQGGTGIGRYGQVMHRDAQGCTGMLRDVQRCLFSGEGSQQVTGLWVCCVSACSTGHQHQARLGAF